VILIIKFLFFSFPFTFKKYLRTNHIKNLTWHFKIKSFTKTSNPSYTLYLKINGDVILGHVTAAFHLKRIPYLDTTVKAFHEKPIRSSIILLVAISAIASVVKSVKNSEGNLKTPSNNPLKTPSKKKSELYSRSDRLSSSNTCLVREGRHPIGVEINTAYPQFHDLKHLDEENLVPLIGEITAGHAVQKIEIYQEIELLDLNLLFDDHLESTRLNLEQLKTLLSIFPNLKWLRLPFDSLLDKNALKLLEKFPLITHLEIKNSPLPSSSIFNDSIDEELDNPLIIDFKNLKQLTTLSLHEVPIRNNATVETITSLHNLRSFSLKFHDLKLEPKLYLMENLNKLSNLNILILDFSLNYTILKERDHKKLKNSLLMALHSLTKLKALELSYCPFVNAEVLNVLPKDLRLLALDFCPLEEAVKGSIKALTHLSHLYLYAVNQEPSYIFPDSPSADIENSGIPLPIESSPLEFNHLEWIPKSVQILDLREIEKIGLESLKRNFQLLALSSPEGDPTTFKAFINLYSKIKDEDDFSTSPMSPGFRTPPPKSHYGKTSLHGPKTR
jgi:hypothetical protein